MTSSNNTLTFQSETDISPVQDGPGEGGTNSHGKWWVVAFSNKIVKSHQDFTHGASDNSLISIDFSAYGKRSADRSGTNLAKIGVIQNGQRREFVGTKPLITPHNIRVPVTVTLSRTSAKMYVNGEIVLDASGLNLPSLEGYWSIGQANYRSGFIDNYGAGLDQPRITNQIVHWDTIQFDGLNAQNYIPLVRTYQAPNCTGPIIFHMRAHQMLNCPYLITRGRLSSDFTININEDPRSIRSAKLILNGPRTSEVLVQANNTEIARFAPTDSNYRLHHIDVRSLSASQLQILRQGTNNIKVSTSGYSDYRGVGGFQLEVVYNTPKTFPNPPLGHSHRLAALGTDFGFDKKNYPSGVARGIAFLYSAGGGEAINYTISSYTTNTPWIRVLSPTAGQAKAIAEGGVALFRLNLKLTLASL